MLAAAQAQSKAGDSSSSGGFTKIPDVPKKIPSSLMCCDLAEVIGVSKSSSQHLVDLRMLFDGTVLTGVNTRDGSVTTISGYQSTTTPAAKVSLHMSYPRYRATDNVILHQRHYSSSNLSDTNEYYNIRGKVLGVYECPLEKKICYTVLTQTGREIEVTSPYQLQPQGTPTQSLSHAAASQAAAASQKSSDSKKTPVAPIPAVSQFTIGSDKLNWTWLTRDWAQDWTGFSDQYGEVKKPWSRSKADVDLATQLVNKTLDQS